MAWLIDHAEAEVAMEAEVNDQLATAATTALSSIIRRLLKRWCARLKCLVPDGNASIHHYDKATTCCSAGDNDDSFYEKEEEDEGSCCDECKKILDDEVQDEISIRNLVRTIKTILS